MDDLNDAIITNKVVFNDLLKEKVGDVSIFIKESKKGDVIKLYPAYIKLNSKILHTEEDRNKFVNDKIIGRWREVNPILYKKLTESEADRRMKRRLDRFNAEFEAPPDDTHVDYLGQ